MKLFWPKINDFEVALADLQNAPLNELFDDEVIDFTQSLSKRFVRMRQFPEIVALGYWMRKANIKQMQAEFEKINEYKFIRARGITFHIAPANVDTIFVYSWILSILAGNKNVIRLSSKSEVTEVLHSILEEIPKFGKIAKQTLICTYNHEENATALLSKICHTRVIWGGDVTIAAIRNVPLAPMANELAFPDRFSLAVLHAEQVNALDKQQLDTLLDQFYNDVFWFDQMACSSPRLIVWIGKTPQQFWHHFEQKMIEKRYELLAATQVLKYATTLQLAAKPFVEKIQSAVYYSRVQLDEMPSDVREQHCGGGLFYELELNSLEDLAEVLIDKDQTIAYFGFAKKELAQLVDKIQTRGIDRIVPVGRALDFSGIWDGQSFLTSFTREVVIL